MSMAYLGVDSTTTLQEEIRVLINQLPEDRRQHFLDRLKICKAWADRGVEGDDAVASQCLRELRVDVGLELLRASVGLPALKPKGAFEAPAPPPTPTPTPTPRPEDKPEDKPESTPFPVIPVVLGSLAGVSLIILATLFVSRSFGGALVMEPAIASPPEDTGPAPLLLDHLWEN